MGWIPPDDCLQSWREPLAACVPGPRESPRDASVLFMEWARLRGCGRHAAFGRMGFDGISRGQSTESSDHPRILPNGILCRSSEGAGYRDKTGQGNAQTSLAQCREI